MTINTAGKITAICIFGLIMIFSPNSAFTQEDIAVNNEIFIEATNRESLDSEVGRIEEISEISEDSEVEVASITEITEEETLVEDNEQADLKTFVNPWLNEEFDLLKKLLEQNWLFKKRLSHIRQLRLMLVAHNSEDRHFRRSAEFITRDPGIRRMFCSLSIFPMLLKTASRMSQSIFALIGEKLLKNELEPVEAIELMEKTTQLNNDLLVIAKTLVNAIEQKLHEFEKRNHTHRNLSCLLSGFLEQNSAIKDKLFKINQNLDRIINQMLLIESRQIVQLDFFKRNMDTGRIKMAARVKQMSQKFVRILYYLDDFNKTLEEFTFKFLKYLDNIEKDLVNSSNTSFESNSIDQSGFEQLLQRDRHPDITGRFEFLNSFESACVMLDKLYQIEKELQNSEIKEPLDRNDFSLTVAYLHEDISAWDNFSELLEEVFYPEKLINADGLNQSHDL